MFCNQLTANLGFACFPLDEEGRVFLIDTPFCFQDGNHIPLYVEVVGKQFRFFDDGAAYMHFAGLGLNLGSGNQIKFLKNAAEINGGTFNERGEIELWVDQDKSGQAFARYVSTLAELVRWERERKFASHDSELFIEEVAQYLSAWKRVEIKRQPKIHGITGREYVLDFEVDGTLVLAVSAHPSSTSAALHKLVDIKGRPDNSATPTLVVIDDRKDPNLAHSEGLVLSSVSAVIRMGQLQINAGTPNTLM